MTKNKRKRLLVWVLFVWCFSTFFKLCRRNGHLVRGQGIVKVYKTGGLLPSLAGAWRRHHKWLQTWSRGPIWKAKTLLLLEKTWKIFVVGYKEMFQISIYNELKFGEGNNVSLTHLPWLNHVVSAGYSMSHHQYS